MSFLLIGLHAGISKYPGGAPFMTFNWNLLSFLYITNVKNTNNKYPGQYMQRTVHANLTGQYVDVLYSIVQKKLNIVEQQDQGRSVPQQHNPIHGICCNVWNGQNFNASFYGVCWERSWLRLVDAGGSSVSLSSLTTLGTKLLLSLVAVMRVFQYHLPEWWQDGRVLPPQRVEGVTHKAGGLT